METGQEWIIEFVRHARVIVAGIQESMMTFQIRCVDPREGHPRSARAGAGMT
jgi:hypothetical protein